MYVKVLHKSTDVRENAPQKHRARGGEHGSFVDRFRAVLCFVDHFRAVLCFVDHFRAVWCFVDHFRAVWCFVDRSW